MTLHKKAGASTTKQYHCAISKEDRYLYCTISITSQPAFACSKEIMETLEE